MKPNTPIEKKITGILGHEKITEPDVRMDLRDDLANEDILVEV